MEELPLCGNSFRSLRFAQTPYPVWSSAVMTGTLAVMTGTFAAMRHFLWSFALCAKLHAQTA
jgi:hypothetical protein